MAFLGLDVAKDKVDCCLLTERCKKPKRCVIQHNSAGFDDLQKWLGAQELPLTDLITVLEPTGIYSYNLTQWLYSKKASVRLVQPTQARYFARYHKVNSKNDEIDSLMLAQMGKEKADELPEWKPLPSLHEEILFLLRRMDQVVKTRQIEKNRLEGHGKIKAFAVADKYTKLTVEFYNKQETQIIEEIADLVAKDAKLNADVKLLKTIPGIGEKTAPILAILLNTRNFKSASQFAKFLGVIPKDNKSGCSVGSPSRMSKAGSSSIRAKLYMGGKAVVRENARDSRLKQFYQALINRGKHEGSAHGALMHKMAVVAYGVWKSQKPYDDDYETHRIQTSCDAPTPTVDMPVSFTIAMANINTTEATTDNQCSKRKRACRSSRKCSEETETNNTEATADNQCSKRKRACRSSR